MSEYVAIGELALELGTSCQKAGQIVKYLGIAKRSMRQGKWYKMCIEEKHVPRIKEVYKDFSVTRDKKEKAKAEEKKSKIKHHIGDNLDRFFTEPIIGRYWGNGTDERWGQGLQTVWEKERCEIC